MVEVPNDPKVAPTYLSAKELSSLRQQLHEDAERLRERIYQYELKCGDEYIRKLSNALGVDLVQLSKEVMVKENAENQEILQDYKKLIELHNELGVYELNAYNYNRQRIQNIAEPVPCESMFAHIAMDKCFEWEIERSPPLGFYPYGTGGSVSDRIVTERDTASGKEFVVSLHPVANAHIDDKDRYGRIRSWVRQRLTFEHPAPQYRMDVNEVEIDLLAHFRGDIHNSHFWSPSMTRAWLTCGADAYILFNAWIEQDTIWPSGYERGSNRFEITSDRDACYTLFHNDPGYCLGRLEALGGYWFWRPASGNFWNPNIFNITDPIRIKTSFPIYGYETRGDEPIGMNVRVVLDFFCQAYAVYENARAEIGCTQEDDFIAVQKIVLWQRWGGFGR
jgi:hypothetical protein